MDIFQELAKETYYFVKSTLKKSNLNILAANKHKQQI